MKKDRLFTNNIVMQESKTRSDLAYVESDTKMNLFMLPIAGRRKSLFRSAGPCVDPGCTSDHVHVMYGTVYCYHPTPSLQGVWKGQCLVHTLSKKVFESFLYVFICFFHFPQLLPS